MILVDRSIWVDHLRREGHPLAEVLQEGVVLTHPFVVGELACGNLRKRKAILELLAQLPCAEVAEHAEVLSLVARRKLSGRRLGWVDAHLLASALLSNCTLWTRDRALADAAKRLKVDV